MTDLTLFSTSWHFISAILVFLVGALIALGLRRTFQCTPARALSLYIWHTIFAVVYAMYIIKNGGDAFGYYKNSLFGNIQFELGTRAVEILISFFTQGFGLSFLGVSFVFQIFGFIGLLAFDAALRDVTKNKPQRVRQLATVIVFLPSVSFWSAGLGKDSLSFMAMGLALWAAMNLSRRALVMLLALAVMLYVRPHMTAMMIMALAGSFVFQRRVSLVQRVFFGSAAFAAAVVMVPLALNFSQLGSDSSADEIMTYIEGRQGHNLEGGGGVDIASMSLPMKLFTYLFRPLPFEAHSVASLFASIDNMIMLFLFAMGIKALLKKQLPIHLAGHNRMFMWFYCFMAWGVLAMTTANLGIAVRQKWMFAPILFFLLISLIGKEKRIAAAEKTIANLPDATRLN